MPDRVSVYWTYETRRRLWALIDNVKTEVGGFGYAALEEGGEELIWYDVFLVPQEADKASIDYDASGLEYAVERAAKDGVLGKPDHVWVSWHSHNSMKAFWSGTDEGCIDTYGGAGMPVLLSFVGNHDHEYKSRLDFFGVKHHGITIPKVTMNDLSVELDSPEPQDPFVEGIMLEIDEYVKKPSYTWHGGGQMVIRGRGRRRGRTQQSFEELEAAEASERQASGDNGFENIGGAVLWVGDGWEGPGYDGTGWDDPDEAALELESGGGTE